MTEYADTITLTRKDALAIQRECSTAFGLLRTMREQRILPRNENNDLTLAGLRASAVHLDRLLFPDRTPAPPESYRDPEPPR